MQLKIITECIYNTFDKMCINMLIYREEVMEVKKKFKVIRIIISVIIFILVSTIAANVACLKITLNSIKEIPASGCAELKFENYANGCYNITTDKDFKVMQLTDIHIGGGWMSVAKDKKALNAVAAMITAEKPDLVVVSGDLTFPVPFMAGTFNNKTGATEVAELMEQLGVYWTLCFGNHDTEAYSYYNREKISEFYSSDKYPHCLFQAGPEDVDGYGNQLFNIKNSKGEVIRSIIIFDSHAYKDDDLFGIKWHYDNIHQNQVDWYAEKIEEVKAMNNGKIAPSSVIMHIPLVEYKDAWYEYMDNGMKDTKDVKFISGAVGEEDPYVLCGVGEDNLFEKIIEKGSTDSLFFGHDHLNYSVLNCKGIDMVYGYSIDYLAYSGIDKKGAQRGCTILNISAEDGSQEIIHENYYQDKYKPVFEKEEVTM